MSLVMDQQSPEPGIVLTPEQMRRRRARSIAIALALAALVLLVYLVTIVKLGPRLATPASELRPAYPPSKLASEEEAVLRLRLTIDANGRVTAVDPVGAADRAFLEAARRHLIAHWRYKPATEDGHAVASSAVITLRFVLDG